MFKFRNNSTIITYKHQRPRKRKWNLFDFVTLKQRSEYTDYYIKTVRKLFWVDSCYCNKNYLRCDSNFRVNGVNRSCVKRKDVTRMRTRIEPHCSNSYSNHLHDIPNMHTKFDNNRFGRFGDYVSNKNGYQTGRQT